VNFIGEQINFFSDSKPIEALKRVQNTDVCSGRFQNVFLRIQILSFSLDLCALCCQTNCPGNTNFWWVALDRFYV